MTGANLSIEGGEWRLSGDLKIFLLSTELSHWMKQFPKEGPWKLLLEGVTRMDTGGLAFLLACVKHAKSQQLEVHFKSVPESVWPLARAQGVAELLKAYVQ